MAWTHGKFQWNELMTRDAEGLEEILRTSLGWTFDGMPMPHGGTYWVAKVGDDMVAGLMPLDGPQFARRSGAWLGYNRRSTTSTLASEGPPQPAAR